MKQQKITKRDFRGQYLNQESLSFDLEYATFGLRSYIFVALVVLILMVCLIASIFPGILGAIIGLELVLKGKTWVQALLTSIVIAAWLLSIISQADRRGLLAVAIGLLASVTLYWLFIRLGIAEPVPMFFAEAASTTLSIFAVWTICVAVLYLIRVSLASLDVLFKQTQKAKGLTILAAVVGTIVGALIAIPLEAQIIEVSANAQVVGVLSGITFGLVLALSGWWINRCQNVPWTHPDLLRSWALKIGSWRGTSFHNLDLGGVSFKGARLANTDLRARAFYRTCFQGATGLERARVNSQYLDLENPKIQKLLARACSEDQNFRGFNLQGAYLQNADMRGFDLTDTNLTGADLKGADLRGSRLIRTQLAGADLGGVDLRTNILIDANLTESNLRGTDLRDCILVRAQVARADFTGADLTGACIEDWSVSSKTIFTNVRCDYVFRQYENGQPAHRYPSDRNFESGEFAALFQQPENELELIFKGDFSYSALSLAFDKLKTEKPELDLELKGIEQRGNLWVVLVTSNNPTVEAELEQQFSEVYQTTTNSDSLETTIKDSIYRDYEDIKQRLAESQQLVRQFAGISESQAEALKQLSKQALGTNFYIEGSNITNLTGQGQIEYTEAAGQIRSLVTRGGTKTQVSQGSQQVLAQLQDIAVTPQMQTELIQQILLREAQSDPAFRRFLLQQQQQILMALPPGTIGAAIQRAIAQLNNEGGDSVT